MLVKPKDDKTAVHDCHYAGTVAVCVGQVVADGRVVYCVHFCRKLNNNIT